MLNIVIFLKRRVRALRAFRDDTSGTVAVEAAIIFPVVMWCLLATFVFFEGYRQTAINHKAASTLADMYSRETASITSTYVDNTKQLFDLLAEANGETKIRVSVVKWSERQNQYQVDWSKSRGMGTSELTTSDLQQMVVKLPTLPAEERIILIETWSTYSPIFKIGMEPTTISTFVFTRLRFAPQLRYSMQDTNV